MNVDWFRSWHGAPTDPKWLVIAKRAGVPHIFVPAVAWALFDYASQTEDRGSVAGFDFETYALQYGIAETQVRAIYEAMEVKGLIISGRLAKWDRRQPKREDGTSSERQRAVRARKDAEPSLPLPASQVPPKADAAPELSPPENVPEKVAPPLASPAQVLISDEASDLADEIAVICGHDIRFVPEAWCGAAARVQMWFNNGWRAQIILDSVKAQIARKRDGPPDRVQYFEKGIARAIAEQAAPLPNVVPFSPETIQVRHGKVQSGITAAADRVISELEGGGGTLREGAARFLPDGRRQ